MLFYLLHLNTWALQSIQQIPPPNCPFLPHPCTMTVLPIFFQKNQSAGSEERSYKPKFHLNGQEGCKWCAHTDAGLANGLGHSLDSNSIWLGNAWGKEQLLASSLLSSFTKLKSRRLEIKRLIRVYKNPHIPNRYKVRLQDNKLTRFLWGC